MRHAWYFSSTFVFSFSCSDDNERLLTHYRNIWDGYKVKYEKFPKAQRLRAQQAREEELRVKTQQTKERLENLRSQVQHLQSKPWHDIFCWSKFFPLRFYPHLNRLPFPRKQQGNHKSCVIDFSSALTIDSTSLKKIAETHGGLHFHKI